MRRMSVLSQSSNDLCWLVRGAIDATRLVAHVKAPEDGAVATFEGVARNHSRGRHTLYLEYEAYESMALEKMRELGREMRRQFPVHRLAMAHRLGRIAVGETSVFIAVSATHRAAALDACRWAIDTLKKTVPIWKKEFFADGAVWAEGEVPAIPAPSRAAKA
jgi:molybdopterin synthase catalytic subunit